MGTDDPSAIVETTPAPTADSIMVLPLVAVIIVLIGVLVAVLLRAKFSTTPLGPSRKVGVAAHAAFLVYLIAAIASKGEGWSAWLLPVAALLFLLSLLPDRVLEKQAKAAVKGARKRFEEDEDKNKKFDK